VRNECTNTDKWVLTDTQEIRFFLGSIRFYLHTQRENKIVEALIQHLETPTEETKEALQPFLKKHNMQFFILEDYLS